MPQSVILANGIEGVYIKNTRFKTARISFNFYLPLQTETVAANALLPCVLTSCSNKYPSFIELNRRLKQMYGAGIAHSSAKVDDLQCISVAVTVLCDRFTPDGSPLVANAANLLADIIFNPRLDGQSFFEQDVKREKRQLIERIEGEINDKRTFARRRLIEEMYEGLPYGLSGNGTAQQVNQLDGKLLFEAWQNMLRSAYVRIQVVGDVCPDGIFAAAASAFSAIKRENITNVTEIIPTDYRENVKHITERFKVAQGKLVMGFSSKAYGDTPDNDAFSVAADVIGGGPHSLCFENVREKQSLCYYCKCTGVRNKGMLIVDSGVEAKNAFTAQQEILKQFEIVKNNEFSEEIFAASKRNMTSSILAINDSLNALDTWYALRIRQKVPATPEDMAKRFAAVTRQQVVDVAKGFSLNTVYMLMPENFEEKTGDNK